MILVISLKRLQNEVSVSSRTVNKNVFKDDLTARVKYANTQNTL